MGHHLIDDALENQDQFELISYSEELGVVDYVKVSYHTILTTPNDAELGELVRNTLYELQKNR
jgi:hypothetical protein